MELSEQTRSQLPVFQSVELTEHLIYAKLARSIRSPENRKILEQISADELRHAHLWQKYTGKELKPKMMTVWFYYLISRIFGFTFGIKLMEKGEAKAQVNYGELSGVIPEIEVWIQDEEAHEKALIGMLDEEVLRYAGSVVLGLNDALVELTGALAGLTLALQNTQLIALSGLITGVAASLSMAASEYLSTRTEPSQKKPVKAAVYTGITYVVTVTLLIIPYLLINNYILDLGISLATAVIIIAVFNYYISVARDESFSRRFLEMALLSLSVAAISFGIGYLIRVWLGVNI
jgi:VIT1/CCC1 family predicted Fe2+/Mn2+ transporter